jgi:hypothetical protein
MITSCNADVNISDNGKANVRNSLIHILNCCIFCCYIMTSMWWTFSLQPNQTRLWWKSDVFVGRWRNRTCLGNRTRLWKRTHLWVLHIYITFFIFLFKYLLFTVVFAFLFVFDQIWLIINYFFVGKITTKKPMGGRSFFMTCIFLLQYICRFVFFKSQYIHSVIAPIA